MDMSATGRAPPVGVESAINIDVAASSATHSTAGEPLRPDLAAPPPEKAGFSPDPDKQYQYREGELVRVVNDEHERYDQVPPSVPTRAARQTGRSSPLPLVPRQVGFVTSINDEGTVTVEFVDSSVEESASKIQALARGRMVREGKSSRGAATIRSYGQFYLATARMRRQPLVHELWSRGAHRLSGGQPHSESDEGAEFALALADETGDGGEEQEEVLSPRRKRFGRQFSFGRQLSFSRRISLPPPNQRSLHPPPHTPTTTTTPAQPTRPAPPPLQAHRRPAARGGTGVYALPALGGRAVDALRRDGGGAAARLAGAPLRA